MHSGELALRDEANFLMAFIYPLNQRIKDIRCGTKSHLAHQLPAAYNELILLRWLWPHSDFDLIFRAGKLNLKFIEILIPYCACTYG